ncbi:hypothetical protein M9H77_18585 [Catharanthus roseus]|uniref:Uncharacterized protein n=1 Tax=Catharanthus roseus TaxID=4058 RepID=A0ACC0B7U9_CATRO|nr:hypothetical protein M9H77_18585 [Catharanthus roseus]
MDPKKRKVEDGSSSAAVGRIPRYRPLSRLYHPTQLIRDPESHISSVYVFRKIWAYEVLGISPYRLHSEEDEVFPGCCGKRSKVDSIYVWWVL